MNLFQLLVIPILAGLVLMEVRANLKNHQTIHLLRMMIWLTGMVLIVFPGLASRIADLLGIGRGTDLVFYVFMLLSTGGMFYLYGRNLLLRRDIVELVRRDALREATAGIETESADLPTNKSENVDRQE